MIEQKENKEHVVIQIVYHCRLSNTEEPTRCKNN